MGAQYISFFLISTITFYYGKSFQPFALFENHVKQTGKSLLRMFTVGWPISVQMGGEMLSFTTTTLMIGWISISALAAAQIVNQYSFLILVPIFSLSQASGILVGRACGAKQFHDVKALSYASMLLTLFISVIVGGIFIFNAKHLIAFYIDIHSPANAETLHLALVLFFIVAFSQMLDGLRNVLIGILRGLLDTRIPMIIGLFNIWIIGIPLAYVLGFVYHQGIIGVALGNLIGLVIGVSAMFFRFHTLIQRDNFLENT
jgi:MATE family multidrug resistance protein